MITNKSITVWHIRDDLEGYTRQYFPQVSFYGSDKMIHDGTDGFYHQTSYSIRIPTTHDVKIFVGDYIRVGKHTDTAPDAGTDLKVMAVSDNRRGINKHWRVVCE